MGRVTGTRQCRKLRLVISPSSWEVIRAFREVAASRLIDGGLLLMTRQSYDSTIEIRGEDQSRTPLASSMRRLRCAVRTLSLREVSASEVSKSSERGEAQGGYGEMGST